MQSSKSTVLAISLVAGLFVLPGLTAAADNSGVVILDQQHRSTPFGQYDSRRQTQVFGPSSGHGDGYRYEEYSYPAPGVIIAPNTGRYGYGNSVYSYGGYGNAARGHGRVIEHFGPGAYGPYGAGAVPAAPRIDRYGNRYCRPGYRDDGRHGHHRRHHFGPGRSPDPAGGFGRDPSRRAIAPSQRAIEPARRAIGQ